MIIACLWLCCNSFGYIKLLGEITLLLIHNHAKIYGRDSIIYIWINIPVTPEALINPDGISSLALKTESLLENFSCSFSNTALKFPRDKLVS